MLEMRKGVPPADRTPKEKGSQNSYELHTNSSANNIKRKSKSETIFGEWDRAQVQSQLQSYLDLGLIPIPVKDKRPLLKWKQWQPKDLVALQRYIRPGVNWAVRTGSTVSAIDFDTKQAFNDFIVENIGKLPLGMPIVKTGRGYHIWFKPTRTIRNQHFEGIDIKGENGYVVAPPSWHKNGNKYSFVNSPKGCIPELDIDTLEFPKVKPQSNRQQSQSKAKPENRTVEPAFDFERIIKGVGEGERHTALVSYIGSLIKRNHFKEEIVAIINDWNKRNHPPLPQYEIDETIDNTWMSWGHQVSTKTLQQCNSVFIETRDIYEEAKETDKRLSEQEEEPKSAWDLEQGYDPVANCGRKRRVMRSGRKYLSVSFFCGRWDCPKCGSYFKSRWIEHLADVTEDQELSVLECGISEWGRIRRAINRAKIDYIRVENGDNLTVILNKEFKDSIHLTEPIEEFLKKTIPDLADHGPVTTSRGWQRVKETKPDTGYKLVTYTDIPTFDQLEIAKELGAKIKDYGVWITPEDADEDEWETEFIERVTQREKEVAKGDKKVREEILRHYKLDNLYKFVYNNPETKWKFGC